MFYSQFDTNIASVPWTILSKPEACTFIKKETLTQVFSCEICEVLKNIVFIEHLRTAASKTFSENSLGNLARCEKFSARNEKPHIISIPSTRLTELKFSARVENLHIISPLDV